MRREQHQRWRLRVIGDVAHREHAAVAVADHHWRGKSARGHPTRGDAVVLDALARELKRASLGNAAVRVLRMSCPRRLNARQAS